MKNMEELILDVDNADDMGTIESTEITENMDSLGYDTDILGSDADSTDGFVPEENNSGLIRDNRGIGVVEIVLILVVLVALVIIFKDKIMEIINSAFESITGGASSL